METARLSLDGALRLVKTVATRWDRALNGNSYHAGPMLANQLGYQVARAVYKSAAWRMRSAAVASEIAQQVETLERDGILLIPNFLSPEVFARIRSEYDESRRSLAYKPWVVEDNDVIEEMVDVAEHPDAFPVTRRELVENLTIYSLVSGALRRPVTTRPRTTMKHWHRAPERQKPRGPGHVIGANYLHADVHYPTFKAWLYLNDIDASNGAFVFARGSHHMTLARLGYEYDASIRAAKERGVGSELPAALVRTPTERQLERMHAPLQQACGKANTLVIANTQGLHKQGEFAPGAVREKVMLCFRAAEPR